VPLVAGHDVPEASFAGKVQQAFRARVFGG
jgi:hypothetical protein